MAVVRISASGVTPSPVVIMKAPWLEFWSVCVALAWLLPNHYPPWTTFHLDFWMACMMLATAFILLIRARKPVAWSGFPLLVSVVMLVPMAQYASGLLVQLGNAWISSAYLLALLLAWLTGARWETTTRGQLADGLFLAIGLAGLVSVGLALHQWLQLDRLDIWSMGGGATRPFANLGQPNQLGTLLIWGLLAVAWGLARQRVGAPVAILAACYLLFGLALTGSRTGWVAVSLVLAASWVWRRHWPGPHLPWVLAALGLFFASSVASINLLASLIHGNVATDVADIVRVATESRPVIWRMFLDAALQRPWFGYGWNQVGMAQMAVALDHPALHIYFAHSHNLFLDLVLWSGWPLGVAVSAFLLWWIASRGLRVASAKDAILFLLVLMVANHAMLELPLHHAYFLLPVGLVMGALDVRLGIRPVFAGVRWATGLTWVMWCVAAAILALTLRDYSRVEPTIQALRFEWANIRTPPVTPPDVVLLTQWRDYVAMAKVDLNKPASDGDLRWMENVVSLYPSAGFFQVLALSLARRGQPDKAAHWLRVMCSVLPKPHCAGVTAFWTYRATQDPVLAAVPWPR